MKKIFRLLACTGLIALLTGCMDEFDSVFDDGNKDALAPVAVQVAGSGWADLMDDYDRMSTLVKSVLGPVYDLVQDPYQTQASMINDGTLLKNVVTDDGTILTWPDIDFGRYSLVLEAYGTTATHLSITDQRIIREKDHLVLYLEIKPLDGIAGSAFGVPKYSAALYPKLPDLPVEVKRWDNYPHDN